MHGRRHTDPCHFRYGNSVSFIESNGGSGRITASVGNAERIKISLQFSIFPRCAMHTYKNSVKLHFLIIQLKAEVVFVDLCFAPIRELVKPTTGIDVDLIYVEFALVQ